MQALTMQSVNLHLFNLLLLETKSINSLTYETTPVVMGSEEENAVRYASGYVAMKLMKELMKKDTESATQSVCSARFRFQSPSPSFIYGYTHICTYTRT